MPKITANYQLIPQETQVRKLDNILLATAKEI